MRIHRLSALNQVYRNLSLLVSANSCEWIVLSRPINLDWLHAAAVEVVRAHPVLNSVQTKRGLFYCWQELDDPITVDIRHQHIAEECSARLHALLVANIHREPLPLTRSRPWRLHVTEDPSGRTWLQIITTHVFTDGRSANVVARDLAATYSAIARQQTHSLQPPQGTRDPFELFTQQLPPAERRRLCWAALKAIFSDATRRCTGLKTDAGPSGDTAIDFFDYGAAAWAELHSASRRAGLSVHPFILAAVLRTVEQLNARRGARSPVIRIVDNFSLRRFARDRSRVEDIYDVFAMPYTLDFATEQNDAALVRQIRDRFDQLKSGVILRELYRYLIYHRSGTFSEKKMSTRMVSKSVIKTNVICTNIGPVPEDFTAFGDSRVEDYYSFSQMFPPGELMFLFSTYRGHLRLVLLHDDRRVSQAVAREIGERLFTCNLQRVIDGYPGTREGTAPLIAVQRPAPASFA